MKEKGTKNRARQEQQRWAEQEGDAKTKNRKKEETRIGAAREKLRKNHRRGLRTEGQQDKEKNRKN